MALFVIAFVMSVTALSFVAMPLVSSQRLENRGSVSPVLLGVLAVFGLGIALYAVIGSPDLPSHASSSRSATATPTQGGSKQEKAASVSSLLAGLEKRLEENPQDGKGWLLLAQSYEVLGRLDSAKSAYAKAEALGVSNEELAVRLSGGAKNEVPEVTIRGRVEVDPSIGKSIGADAVVYVIAKAEGNPMPLAVLRRPASDLPFNFVLSDENSMVKGAGMAAENALTISVKVSRSGDALAGDSEFAASVHGVDPRSSRPLDIVIGRHGA